ncbi:hypothetical protein [Butyrivibrio sp. INlla21]|uniref:hypothetical protein n=1 Tax=Butyrivibrio sp. INlla21 TaxID=1520811 RepID=UPI0008F1CCDF|nr:hypothetical protein [Butyrivibrio sp. INlla21]SFU43998.1 hypothetical protein SAMN02910342_00527 [Butyrivibrio sp. INlla21]
MKRKNLKLLIATTVVTSLMLAGCGETELSADTQASSEVSIEAVTEASAEKTSDADTATEAVSTEEADTLNSTESTSSAGTTATVDEASTSVSVPEFSSADEEEQWVLEQISGVWETCYKPAELCNIEGTDVSYYGNNWYDDGNDDSMYKFRKSDSRSKVKYIGKSSDQNGDYYEFEFSGAENRTYYWYPGKDAYMFVAIDPYSASDSFERSYGYDYNNRFTINDYNVVE